jgi:hypothetical protein
VAKSERDAGISVEEWVAKFRGMGWLSRCSTTGKPTRLFRTKRSSLDSV